MTKEIETALLAGLKKAYKDYFAISDGQWLSHGPEHFIEVVVAQTLMKHRYHSYINSSNGKTFRDIADDETLAKGPKEISRVLAGLGSQRPDLTIWHKVAGTVNAVVEIKRAWSAHPVVKDCQKLEKMFQCDLEPKNAYMLVYTSAGESKRTKNPRELIKKRFEAWKEATGWSCVENYISHNSKNGAWGGCLLKKIN